MKEPKDIHQSPILINIRNIPPQKPEAFDMVRFFGLVKPTSTEAKNIRTPKVQVPNNHMVLGFRVYRV